LTSLTKQFEIREIRGFKPQVLAQDRKPGSGFIPSTVVFPYG